MIYVLTYDDGDRSPSVDLFDTDRAVREYIAEEFQLNCEQINSIMLDYPHECDGGAILRVKKQRIHS